MENFSTFGLENSVVNAFSNIENNQFPTDHEYIDIFRESIKTPEFKKHRRKTWVGGDKMDFSYKLVEEYLSNANSFLDYGCGKLALVRKISAENSSLQRIIGFDPKSNPRFISENERITFLKNKSELAEIEKVDLAYSSFVFHHLDSEQIRNAFEIISKKLNTNSKFILLEETFPIDFDSGLLEKSKKKLHEIGYTMSEDLVKEFDAFNYKEKFLAIYLNDYLNNLGNLDYMPWTFEYKSMEEWTNIAEEFGFALEEKYFFGVIKKKGMKQGITGMMVFRKG